MRPVDVGVDAARMLRVPGPGVVRAVFPKALYLRVPGGLLALATTEVPRGSSSGGALAHGVRIALLSRSTLLRV